MTALTKVIISTLSVIGVSSIVYISYMSNRNSLNSTDISIVETQNTLITDSSIGDIYVGMEVSKIIEKGFDTRYVGEESYERYMTLSTPSDGDLITIGSKDGYRRVWHIFSSSDIYKTSKGIGVGSTLKDIASIYPTYSKLYIDEMTTDFYFVPSDLQATNMGASLRMELVIDNYDYVYDYLIDRGKEDFDDLGLYYEIPREIVITGRVRSIDILNSGSELGKPIKTY